mgnify:CR=1 FL=1
MGEKIRILLVDDNDIGRYSTKKTLESSNYEVIEADTGRKAVELAKETMPDLILLDVNLPDINGFEVLKLLKSGEKTKNIPIVYLSATYKDTASKVFGIDVGADSYLVQPIEKEELFSTIKAILRMKRAELEETRLRKEKELIFSSINEGIVFLDKDGVIKDCNPAFLRICGKSKEEALNKKCHLIVHGVECSPEYCIYEKAKVTQKRETTEIKINDKWYNFIIDPIIENNEIVGAVHLFTDITELKNTILELQKALEEINVLSGLIPICMNCKKIRNDAGYWERVEEYFTKHSNILFSHGLCPDCAKKLYPDFDFNKKK